MPYDKQEYTAAPLGCAINSSDVLTIISPQPQRAMKLADFLDTTGSTRFK